MVVTRSRRPIVIAHRGASAYLPEHCLAGKALAHGMGADFLEQDVIATRDGAAIVFHDLTLDATTDVAERFPDRVRSDGLHYCIDFDLAELRQLRILERIDPGTGRLRYPDRFPRNAAVFRIVTLAEELDFIRGLNASTGREAGVYTEIKDPAWHQEQGVDLSSLVLDALDHAGYLEPGQAAFLQCFDAQELQRLRERIGPGLAMIQLLGDELPAPAVLAGIAEYAQGIGPSLNAVLGRTGSEMPGLSAARETGLLVHPYTVRADDLPPGYQQFDELLDTLIGKLGVDGLFTDFPDRVCEYLDEPARGAGQSRPQ